MTALNEMPAPAWTSEATKDVGFMGRLLQKSDQWFKVFDIFRHQKRQYIEWAAYMEHKGALQNLAKFCRANASTVGPTVEQTYALIGRREVWLRIVEHMNLSPEQLTDLYGPDKENPNA